MHSSSLAPSNCTSSSCASQPSSHTPTSSAVDISTKLPKRAYRYRTYRKAVSADGVVVRVVEYHCRQPREIPPPAPEIVLLPEANRLEGPRRDFTPSKLNRRDSMSDHTGSGNPHAHEVKNREQSNSAYPTHELADVKSDGPRRPPTPSIARLPTPELPPANPLFFCTCCSFRHGQTSKEVSGLKENHSLVIHARGSSRLRRNT